MSLYVKNYTQLRHVTNQEYKWPVLIQTIDDRTLKDHGIQRIVGKIEDLDLSNRADLSLLWLLIKLKKKYKESSVPINLILDEGRRKSGVSFGGKIFRDWPNSFQGIYSSSTSEPLLQITDFVAFCINRSTHLSMKAQRTKADNWFLKLIGEMQINCEDIGEMPVLKNFSVEKFDAFHITDRKCKGL